MLDRRRQPRVRSNRLIRQEALQNRRAHRRRHQPAVQRRGPRCVFKRLPKYDIECARRWDVEVEEAADAGLVTLSPDTQRPSLSEQQNPRKTINK